MYIVLKEGVGNLFVDNLSDVLTEVSEGDVISVHILDLTGHGLYDLSGEVEQILPRETS